MTWSKHNISFPSPSIDALILWLLRIGSGFAAGLVLLILFFLLAESSPLLRDIQIARIVTDSAWHPTEGAYNLAPMLSGTLYVAGGALSLATPLGIASALFVAYYAPARVAGIYGRVVELLAGIPSVVYGFWGLPSSPVHCSTCAATGYGCQYTCCCRILHIKLTWQYFRWK